MRDTHDPEAAGRAADVVDPFKTCDVQTLQSLRPCRRVQALHLRRAENRLLDHLLGGVVQGAGRLIQEEERGLLQQRPDTGALRGSQSQGTALVPGLASFWADLN